MVRHDQIGDYQIEYCKDAGQVVNSGSTITSAGIRSGDHAVLLLIVTRLSNSGTKDYTVTIEDSADNSAWTAVSGSAVTHSATAKDFGQDLWTIERRSVRRWVRASFTSTGTAHSITAAWLKAGNKVNSALAQTDMVKV